jgi:signal peptidase I
MSVDLRARLARANDLAAPDLWGEATSRAARGVSSIPATPASTRSRVAATAVAFAVFLLAAAVGWAALRPAGDSDVATGGPPHETIDVYEPSGSMLPTIEVGQTVVVDVDAYDQTLPASGDIVAFRLLEFPDLTVLKRVIGLPGDTVRQVDGTVMVNGMAMDEPYAVRDHRTLGPWTVEPGHLFVMGDNRPSSDDSRFSMGQIPVDDILGRALLEAEPSGDAPAPVAPIGTVPEEAPDA